VDSVLNGGGVEVGISGKIGVGNGRPADGSSLFHL